MAKYVQYDTFFWYGALVTIALFAIGHQWRHIRSHLRLRAAASGNKRLGQFLRVTSAPFRPIQALFNAQLPASENVGLPPLGTALFVGLYLAFILALQFYPPRDEEISQGYRSGWLAAAQLPLLIALIKKNNVVGALTGISYERLNVLHRWVARVILIMASLHFYYFYKSWGANPGILHLDWTAKNCVPTGLAAWGLMLWINISTLAPFRRLGYEFFLVQHILCFIAFSACIIIHIPMEETRGKVYAVLPLALWVADRAIRFIRLAERYRYGLSKATLEAFPHPDSTDEDSYGDRMTKIVIAKPNMKKWKSGAHVLVQIPSLAPGQSHPATIASTPASHNGAVVLLLRAHSGFSNLLHDHAGTPTVSRSKSISTEVSGASPEQKRSRPHEVKILLDGPYSPSVPSILSSSSLVFIAAGAGISFILPLLLSVSEAAAHAAVSLPVRRVSLTWSVRDLNTIKIFLKEIALAARRLDQAGIEVKVALHTTRRFARNSIGTPRIAISALQEAHLNEKDTAAGLGLTFSPSRSRPSTSPAAADEASEESIFEELEAEIHTAFVPPRSFRNASVVANMVSTGKEGEWRMLSITSIPAAALGGSADVHVEDLPLATTAVDADVEKGPPRSQSHAGRGMSVGMAKGPGVDVEVVKGRPDVRDVVSEAVEAEAEMEGGGGETGVVVCGPIGVAVESRNAVAGLGVRGKNVWVFVEGGRG